MGLKDFFNKDLETKDLHSNTECRTHYYKEEYNKVKEEILSYLSSIHAKVANVDDNYGEILVETTKYDMIISIKKVTVIEHAVDFKVTMKTMIGANRPAKVIKGYYDQLDQRLTLSSVGRSN